VGWIATSDNRRHPHGAGRFNLLEIEHLTIIQDAQVSSFSSLERKPLQVGSRSLAPVKLGDGFAAKFKELQSQAISATTGTFLNEPVLFEHAQQTMGGTLVQP
jgi:hypothetical protein